MATPAAKSHSPLSPYATDAVTLLGQLIRKARIERRLRAAEVSERAGISRSLLRRVEAGDPSCGIGTVFEVAALVGVQLFDADRPTLSRTVDANRQLMTLLPKAVRHTPTKVDDDF